MLKNKIKLSLVDDYVKLVIFENFLNIYNGSTSKEVVIKINQSSRLKSLYDVIFEKLSMNDCSLLLLKQQLKQNNELTKLCNEQTERDMLKMIFEKLDSIEQNLSYKMTKLKINTAELFNLDYTS